MWNEFLNYLGSLGDPANKPTASTASSANTSSTPDFWQNFGGALTRSQKAGGGLAGLGAALSPQPTTNAPTQPAGANNGAALGGLLSGAGQGVGGLLSGAGQGIGAALGKL